MARISETSARNAPTFKLPDQEWHEFRRAHDDWIAETQNSDGLMYCLNPANIESSLKLYKLTNCSAAAERELSNLCDRHHAIGVCCDEFVRLSLLRPQLAWPPHNVDFAEFLQLGWTHWDIDSIRRLSDPTTKINHRLRAAAGRLISMPSFLEAKAEVRNLWDEMPAQMRPQFPLARSLKMATTASLNLEPAPKALAEFFVEFDEFCDEWHLLGLATWDLPDVRGPHWVPGLASDDTLRRGDMTVTTPWHFPVLAEDGLGPLLEAEHRRQAAERGVDDQESWQTYAKLFEVHFWELVLLGRYSRQQREKAFLTKVNAVLAEMLGLSTDRMQKLRTTLRQLQSGKLKSLRGWR